MITPVVADVSLQTLVGLIKVIGEFINNIASIGVPIWSMTILGFIYFMVKRLLKKVVENLKPDFTSYKEDIIEGVKWEWAWSNSTYRGSYDFAGDSPIPTCNDCKGYLVVVGREYDSYYLECENCGFNKSLKKLSFKEYQARIKREIYRRVKIEHWKMNTD